MATRHHRIALTEADGGVVFHRLPVAEIADPDFRLLLEWWHGKRGERAMPARTDLDPSELRHFLHRLQAMEEVPQFARIEVGACRHRALTALAMPPFEQKPEVRVGDLSNRQTMEDDASIGLGERNPMMPRRHLVREYTRSSMNKVCTARGRCSADRVSA